MTTPVLDGAAWTKLGTAHLGPLQRLLERCADFIRLIEDRAVRSNEAETLLADLPPDRRPEDKWVFGVSTAPGGELTAVVEVVRDYPTAGTWYVGLLLLAPELRGRGRGEQIYGALADWVAGQGGRRLRLAVQEQNPRALRFWTRLGFEPVDSVLQRIGDREIRVARLEIEIF